MEESIESDGTCKDIFEKMTILCGGDTVAGESLTMDTASEEAIDEDGVETPQTGASLQIGSVPKETSLEQIDESILRPKSDDGVEAILIDESCKVDVDSTSPKIKRTVKISNRSVKPSPLAEVVSTSRMISLKCPSSTIVTEKVAVTSTAAKALVEKETEPSALPKRNDPYDVTIYVKPKGTIPSHEKVLASKSTYYMELFKKLPKRDKKIEIQYPHEKLSELKAFIKALYALPLSFDEAHKYLPIAVELKFDKFAQECADLLAKGVNANNCLELKLLSIKFGNQDLGIVAESFILKNLSSVLRTQEFLNIPIETMQELLLKKNLSFSEKQVSQMIDAWRSYGNRKKDGDLFIKLKALELLRIGPGSATTIFEGKPDDFKLPISGQGVSGWVYLQAIATPNLITSSVDRFPKAILKLCQTARNEQTGSVTIVKKENIKKEKIAPLLPGIGQKKRTRILDSDNEDEAPTKVPFKIPKISYRDLDSPAANSWNPLGYRTPTKVIPIPETHPKTKPKPTYKKGKAFSPDAQDDVGSWNDPGSNDNGSLTPKVNVKAEPASVSPALTHAHVSHTPQHLSQPVCCTNPTCANNYPAHHFSPHMYVDRRFVSSCGDPNCRNPHCLPMPMYVNPHHGAHGHIGTHSSLSVHGEDCAAVSTHHGNHGREVQRIPRNSEIESVDKTCASWDSMSIGSNDSGGRGNRTGNRGFGGRNNRNDGDFSRNNNGLDNENRGGRGRGYQGGNKGQNNSWGNNGGNRNKDDDWGNSSSGTKESQDDDWGNGSSGAKKSQDNDWGNSSFGAKKTDSWGSNNNSGGRNNRNDNDFGGRSNRGGFGRGGFRGNRDNNGNGRGFGDRGRGGRRNYGNNDNWGSNSGSSQTAAPIAPADDDWDTPAIASNNSRPAAVAAPVVKDDWGSTATVAVAVNRSAPIIAADTSAASDDWGSTPIVATPSTAVNAPATKDAMDVESAANFELPSVVGFMVKPSAPVKETSSETDALDTTEHNANGAASAKDDFSLDETEQVPAPLPDPRLAPTPMPSPVIPAPIVPATPTGGDENDEWS